ncbi:MAG: hypothetical protein DRP88_03770 [Candidatus Neomarinimicrobiota bacterium]|nr:MAG: hypothetical protein DRP88_03770 [Candidatus Neomarinimicrobiota bacterium]HDN59876.1 hypothetical protein [Candidatus Neomarinimicrobiota bacterium]
MHYSRFLVINFLLLSLLFANSDSTAIKLIKAVIVNQERANLIYDAKTIISFYSLDRKLKTQRILKSRYYVRKGRIIKGERIQTETSLKTPQDFPKYRESKILPLFSPLSWEALPFYNFKHIGEEEKNGVMTIKIEYSPKQKSKELSYGYVWVSKLDTDLVSLEMIASIPFTFTKYFIMKMEYVKLNNVWVPDVINVELEINFLGIYKRYVLFKQKVIRRYFES